MNERFKDLLRALALGMMAGCIGFAVGQLGRLIQPPGAVTFFTLVAGLAAVEAYYSLRVSQGQSLYQIESGEYFHHTWRFRAVELAISFVLIKLGGYIGRPWAAVLADVAAWPGDLGRLFDLQTLIATLLAFFSWLLALQTAVDLQQLDEPVEYHLREDPAIERLRRRFLGGGILLLILTGVARVGVAALLNMSRPPVPGLVLNVLLYFALGLLLLGQVWFATLSQAWHAQQIEVSSGLAQRWVWYTILLCLLAGGVAFLLPTRYTSRTFGLVQAALEAIFTVLQFVAAVIMFLFALILWLLSRLLHLPVTPRPEAPAAPSFPFTPPDVAPAASWLVLLRDVVFWFVLAAILFYLVRSYLRDHPEIGRALAALAPLRWLRMLWRWLRGRAGAWARGISGRSLTSPSHPAGDGGTKRASRWGWRVLSLRERVWYYYVQVLRRARRQGFPRRVSETPDEYHRALAPHLAEAQPELERLTATFVEARYGVHPVEPVTVAHVRRWGQLIKRALRGLQLKRAPDREHGRPGA